MLDPDSGISRRRALRSTALLLGGGIAGCTGGDGGTPTETERPTSTATPTPTPTATSTPDRPNIERQVVLRDKAAITHVRRRVSGQIAWPAYDTYNVVDIDLLGEWTLEDRSFTFFDDLTFTGEGAEGGLAGTYFTVSPYDYLYVEYEDGDEFEYFYDTTTEGGEVVVDFFDTDGDFLATFTRTNEGEDTRSAVEVFEHVVFYESDEAERETRDLETGGGGTGFIVSPVGHIVTNAHVVGTHVDPEWTLYYRLAVEERRAVREALADAFDLDEDQFEEITDVLMDKLFDYYAEKSAVTDVDTAIDVLTGTAAPNEPVEAKSWPATIETTGSVYEDVSDERSWGRDVAILKVDEQEPLPTVPLGDSTGLGTGEKAFVVGYPEIGVEDLFEDRNTSLEPTLTSGIVSARRTLNSGVEAIQTDAGINAGNSGGPVYNSDGEVVGIATFKPPDLELEEIAFALPIEIAKGFMGELGVENEPGELTAAYREGLEALWRDDCESVAERMETVLDLWANHPYAREITESC